MAGKRAGRGTRPRRLGAVVLAAGLLAAGCTKEPALTTPSTVGALVVEGFTGTLAVGGSVFFSFTVPNSGNVSLNLLSLSVAGAPTDVSIALGLGLPRGTDCTVQASTVVVAGPSAQVTNGVTPGVYCVLLTDQGVLTVPVQFAVNVIRPR